MNKYKFALLCAAALFAPASKGAVTSANADGYLDRAVRMYVGHNYEGCLDQLSQLLRMDISIPCVKKPNCTLIWPISISTILTPLRYLRPRHIAMK